MYLVLERFQQELIPTVSFGTNSTTFAAKFADNARAMFGGATQGDFGIYHDTNHSYLHRMPGEVTSI